MRKIIKNNYKIIISILIGIVLSVTTVYAVDAYIESNKVTYTNHNKTNVEEAIDELYDKSGIHKDKWIDPILNGADPVLKSPLIPVEIKPNGDVYYANENSEWYNYSEKRWANAVILVDNPSNTNYKVGDKIEEDDIESYFVWIPRYQYKIWNMGQYTSAIELTQLKNTNENIDTTLGKITNQSRIISVIFGTPEKVPKMNESEAAIDKYYTHPAFTLGDKNLNGIWVGKFETGYKGANDTAGAQKNESDSLKIIVKPDVYSWRANAVKNMFDAAKGYANTLDSHMMKNTEWGAVAYLAHSTYGVGGKVNINNASDYKTGYSAISSSDQSRYPGTVGTSKDRTKTQPWNTQDGYLASTTGNITGVYDMSGGALEYMAACMDGYPGNSGFSVEELANYVKSGYIDSYSKDITMVSFNKRILGDATGELGPFYQYIVGNNFNVPHNPWHSEEGGMVDATFPWFARGGRYEFGGIAGLFDFRRHNGIEEGTYSFRLVLAPEK